MFHVLKVNKEILIINTKDLGWIKSFYETSVSQPIFKIFSFNRSDTRYTKVKRKLPMSSSTQPEVVWRRGFVKKRSSILHGRTAQPIRITCFQSKGQYFNLISIHRYLDSLIDCLGFNAVFNNFPNISRLPVYLLMCFLASHTSTLHNILFKHYIDCETCSYHGRCLLPGDFTSIQAVAWTKNKIQDTHHGFRTRDLWYTRLALYHCTVRTCEQFASVWRVCASTQFQSLHNPCTCKGINS